MGTNVQMVRRQLAEIDAAKAAWSKSSDVTKQIAQVTDCLKEIERIADRQRNEILPMGAISAFEQVSRQVKAALDLFNKMS